MSIPESPKFSLWRTGVSIESVAAISTGPQAKPAAGLNLSGYDFAGLVVTQSGGAVIPAVEIVVWVNSAGTWVRAATPAAFTGNAVNEPFLITFSSYGRAVYPLLTAGDGEIDIHVSAIVQARGTY